jgi:hypothetical protein
MRESVFFEVRLRRFDVWRIAVGAVAVVTLATLTAWTLAIAPSRDGRDVSLVVLAAAGLAIATLAVAASLLRVEGGVLACSDGAWTFSADSGAVRAGALEVAMDLGPFLLLRVGSAPPAAWLPVQRLGLEREWHALRCAVYSPPAAAAASPIAPHPNL